MEEGRLAPRSMESKNRRGKRSSSSASPSTSTPATSKLPRPALVPKPSSEVDPSSESEKEDEDGDLPVPVVSDDSTLSHLSLNSADASEDEEGDGVSSEERSGSLKSKKIAKNRRGVPVAVSHTNKKGRWQRSACWKLFKVVDVPSKKEKGVMETKAKCRFCYGLFSYKQGGSNSSMLRHIKKCTPYLNKLGRQKAQQLLGYDPQKKGQHLILMLMWMVIISGSLQMMIGLYIPQFIQF